MSQSSDTIPAQACPKELAMAKDLGGRSWGAPRKPLAASYGRWIVTGPSFIKTGPGTRKYFAPCKCSVHGTERMISETDLRNGTARQCIQCSRSKGSGRPSLPPVRKT